MIKEIYKRLGILPNIEEERKRFLMRVKKALDIIEKLMKKKEADFLRWEIAYVLGDYIPLTLSDFINLWNNFEKNLESIEIILKELKTSKISVIGREGIEIDLYKVFKKEIQKALSLSAIDIGYLFNLKTGQFIRSNVPELDKKLILESLQWLEVYPDTREKFLKSLKHYINKDFPDALTNAYSALEGIVKIFLNQERRLDSEKTRRELIQKLNLKEQWGEMLYFYCKIAHEFSSRHGKKVQKEKKISLTPELVEFYIYFTGAVIRLILQRIRRVKIS